MCVKFCMLQAYIRSVGLFLLFTVFWVRLLYIAAFVVFTMAEAPLIDLHQDGSSPVYAVLDQTGSDTTHSPYTTSQMQHPPTATPYPHASPELPVSLPYLQSPSSIAVSQPTTHLHCQPPLSCSQPSIFTQPIQMFPPPPFGYPQVTPAAPQVPYPSSPQVQHTQAPNNSDYTQPSVASVPTQHPSALPYQAPLHPYVPYSHTSEPSPPITSSPIGLHCLFPSFPVFNGDRDITWWLRQFDEMTTFCNQNDKGRLLILKLGERVQDTVNILPYQQRQNYGMLRRQLMETYAAPPDSGLWYATLMNRKKLAAESVAAYMRDIQRLVGKLNIHPSQRDQYVRNAFLSGLSPDLQLYLGPSRSASPGELLQAATYFEQISKRQYGGDSNSTCKVFQANAPAPREHPFCTPGNCYCCGENGHYKRNCPFLSYAYCPKCDQRGHYPQVCNSFRRQRNRPLNGQGLAPFRMTHPPPHSVPGQIRPSQTYPNQA